MQGYEGKNQAAVLNLFTGCLPVVSVVFGNVRLKYDRGPGSETTCLDADCSSQKSRAPEKRDKPLRKELAPKTVASYAMGN